MRRENPNNNQTEQKLPMCPECGLVIPVLAQVGVVQPWRWQGLCDVLIGNLPRFNCPRCNHEGGVPVATGFFSPGKDRVLLHTTELENRTLIAQINDKMPREWGRRIEHTDDLADLQSDICEHVLSFKPLLKEITRAQQRNGIDDFVKQHWQYLTPVVFAAGLVGFTGLVKGIGGYALNQKSGEKIAVTDNISLFINFFADIQLRVWQQIFDNRWRADDTLESALKQHVLAGGILEENAERLGSIVESVTKDLIQRKDTALNIYTMLALHARVANVEEFEDPFVSLWTHSYVGFELALLKDNDKSLAPWRIDGSKAASTIPERQAWNIFATILNTTFQHSQPEELESAVSELVASLQRVSERLGYDGLAQRVLASSIFSAPESLDDQDLRNFIRSFINPSEISKMPGGLVTWLHQAKTLFTGAGIEAVEKVLDSALEAVGDDLEQRANIEAWFGECAKEFFAPKRFFDRVGTEPRKWEHDLSLESRLSLWNERANSYRLLGRPDRALRITETLLGKIQGLEEYRRQRFVLLRNRGILLREVGAVDAALRQLSDLLDGCALEARAELLESYAATCLVLGRHEEAAASLQEAVDFITSNDPQRAKLMAMLAQVFSLVDRHEEALEILNQLAGSMSHPRVAAVRAATYLNLINKNAQLDEDDLGRLRQLLDELENYLKHAESVGDVGFSVQLLSLLGHLAFQVDPEQSEYFWLKTLTVLAENGQPPDPVAMARLLTVAYLRNRRDEVDSLLHLLPNTLNARFSRIEDLSSGFDTTRQARSAFQDLMSAAIDREAPWSDIRWISEMTRDTIGRAKLVQSRGEQVVDKSQLALGITDEALATLARPHQPMAVLEWGAVHRELFAMLTTIDTDGSVQTEPIQPSNLDLFGIRSHIMHRLSVWHSGRAGDPFNFTSWVQLEQWLQGQIEQRLDDGRHLVLIDHAFLVGLPWHVALAPRWRCSYVPSWMSLLRESRGEWSSPVRVGVFAAPRYKDALAISKAFSESVESTRRWAAAKDYPCEVVENELADRGAFERLMAKCHVIKLLCHGYASPADHEIALLVSHAGGLPPLHVPGDPNLSDVNRLSWRNLQWLSCSAPLVLSAACSTGLQWQAGAGEQMGLFGALRQAGTRSFIGPRWDVEASAVVPLLDEVLMKYFDDKLTLVDALHQTCSRAEARLPKWLAWSISLEGDWR